MLDICPLSELSMTNIFPSLWGTLLFFWWCLWNSSFNFSWSLIYLIVFILFVSYWRNICQHKGCKYFLNVFFWKFVVLAFTFRSMIRFKFFWCWDLSYYVNGLVPDLRMKVFCLSPLRMLAVRFSQMLYFKIFIGV